MTLEDNYSNIGFEWFEKVVFQCLKTTELKAEGNGRHYLTDY